jgi:uncharacterized protein YyaL (SSP411 family)
VDSTTTTTTTPVPSARHAYSGGFYSTEAETLSPTILRLKSGMDKSQPSTNAVSASNLFRLGTLLDSTSGSGEGALYLRQARATLDAFEAEILQYPWLFVSLLTGVVTARLGVRRESVRRGDEERLRRWYMSPRAEARVLVLVEGEEGSAGEEKKGLVGGRPVEGVGNVEAAETRTQAQGEPSVELEKEVEGLKIGSRP